nr:hypothetical protein BaRGS_033271 [Batillaria attramentaria]
MEESTGLVGLMESHVPVLTSPSASRNNPLLLLMYKLSAGSRNSLGRFAALNCSPVSKRGNFTAPRLGGDVVLTLS